MYEIQSILDEGVRQDEADDGPNSEIEYWKTRFSSLNGVLEELKNEEHKTVFAVVKNSNAELSKEWNTFDIKLTDSINESKDNVKYLSTLEKYIEVLYTGKLTQIIDLLPGLLKNITMIFTLSKYYSNKGRFAFATVDVPCVSLYADISAI